MTAPFACTVDEVKANIKRIEHNSDSGNGKPREGSGGSSGNRLGGGKVNTGGKNYDYVKGGK